MKLFSFLKKFDLFSGTQMPDTASELAITALRVFTGLSLALGHGVKKIPVPERFVQYLIEQGFPLPYFLAWVAGFNELFGGFFLAIGLFTKSAAFFLFVTMAVAALYAHRNDPFSEAELSHVYGFISLLFIAVGGGQFSLDRIFRKKI